MSDERGASALVGETDLFTFFHERVEEAVAHQGATVTPNAKFYLSQMLAEQGRKEDDDSTLVELRQRAVQAPPAEAVTLWKRLGDQSLMVTGYFREHLHRRRITPEYCQTMGAAAYAVLARAMTGPRGGFGEIFAELAESWPRCADVLAHVRDETRTRSDTDIVRLYEEWLVTGSPRIAERLRALGVVPARVGGVS